MTQPASGFACPADDALAVEHALVAAWIVAALGTLSPHDHYRTVELKSLPEGRTMLEADAPHARRLVMAALAQLRYYDGETARLRARGKNDFERANPHLYPDWHAAWGPRRQAFAVLSTLMRRALPFDESDLLALLASCDEQPFLSSYHSPLNAIAKAAARHVDAAPPTPAMRDALRAFAGKLALAYDRDTKRLAATVAQLVADASPAAAAADDPAGPARTVVAIAAGDPRVHRPLKRALGLLDASPAAGETIGHDRFEVAPDSPLRAEHDAICTLLDGVVERPGYAVADLTKTEAGRAVLAAAPAERGRLLVAATERAAAVSLNGLSGVGGDHRIWQARYAVGGLTRQLGKSDVLLGRAELFDVLLAAAAGVDQAFVRDFLSRGGSGLGRVAGFDAEAPLTDGERYVLHLARLASVDGPPLGAPAEHVRELTRYIGDRANFWLVPGEAWTDAANADVAAMPADARSAWKDVFRHALAATSARPSGRWLKTADGLVGAVGRDAFADALARWLPLVSRPGTVRRPDAIDVMNDQNATALRGLIWLVPTLGLPTFAPLLRKVAIDANRKLPGVGFRSPRVGNAAIYGLSSLGTEAAIGQLAILKSRLKGSVQRELEKAFDAAATRLGLPRDRIEEMAVPTYGLSDVGRGGETFGGCRAEVHVDGGDARLAWFDAKGKPVKSVPSKVKAEHKEEFKALQQSVKDIAAMLPAQRDRIDALFLAQKSWPLAQWRECYLDHPLVGTIARRLIWLANGVAVAWLDGTLVDLNDRAVDVPDDARVELWHPIGRAESEVLAWREWLARHEVRQPFKQAHREIYLLTDAERRTATYSNRFAAHVLRQHQFNALCAARGWRNKLRLMVDDTYPPATLALPQWNLRAEYWIEGIGEDFGTDTAESGAYLRLSTDQVRFHRIEAALSSAHAAGGGYTTRAAGPGAENVNEPMPLDSIPPLVLSEILRDVDLFVGVASVGNDPTWQDGGPGGRYQTYWQHVSFGELTETAKTRRAVLETLLPRLTKLRGKWSLDDKFLVVRGSIRSYKIHLGSGNILMEPNDQYLCIVADRSGTKSDGVFLPFEGDATLSIILSKAFLLADDATIADPTITRQIRG